MAELRYVGAKVAEDEDLAYRGYVSEVKESDLTAQEIDDLIADELSAYATKAYVADRDALNATKDYIDAGDATRIKLSSRNIPNGVAGLGSDGRVDPAHINAPSSQNYPSGLWVPSSYGSPTTTTSETTLFTTDVTDPGYSYRLAVFGNIDALSVSGKARPIIVIRAGAADGPIIASGMGSDKSADIYDGDFFSRVGATLGSGWDETWTGPGTGHAETDGAAAVYIKQGSSNDRVGRFRRLGREARTPTHYQEIRWRNASDCESGLNFGGSTARNFYYGRVSPDFQRYVGFSIDTGIVRFFYSTNGTLTELGLPGLSTNSLGDEFCARFGTEDGPRHFELLRGETSVLKINDVSEVTPMADTDLGWGFGFRAGHFLAGPFPSEQARPAALDYITISDYAPGDDRSILSYAPVPIIPVSVASQQVRTGALTLYVNLARGGADGEVGAGYADHQSLSIMAVPA